MMQYLRKSKTLCFQKKLHPALFSSKERRELLRSSIDFLLKIDPLQVTHTAINVLRPFVLFSAHLNYSNYWKSKFGISIIQSQTYIRTSYEWTFLAVQDSTIGDLVSESLIKCCFDFATITTITKNTTITTITIFTTETAIYI